MKIGDRIKARRKELKMSAEELGERLGKDRSTIYRYEKGDIENLPLDILKPIASALNTTPQYLMGWDVEDKKEKPTIDDELSEYQQKIIEIAKGLSEADAQLAFQILQRFEGSGS